MRTGPFRAWLPGPRSATCASDQVHDSLGARGVEFDLLPWQRLHPMPLLAYSPIDQIFAPPLCKLPLSVC